MKRVLILCLLVCAFAAPALAAKPQPKLLGQFGKWGAFEHSEGKGKKVCYIAAPPIKSEGKYKKRGDVFILITHRQSEKTRNVVSYIAGYDYDEKKAVIADIDGTQFLMVPNDDAAWTPNQKSDDALTKALKKGKKLVVTGVSGKGNPTRDAYDLKGSTKALEAIDKACKF
jgi:hypothetical protein